MTTIKRMSEEQTFQGDPVDPEPPLHVFQKPISEALEGS